MANTGGRELPTSLTFNSLATTKRNAQRGRKFGGGWGVNLTGAQSKLVKAP